MNLIKLISTYEELEGSVSLVVTDSFIQSFKDLDIPWDYEDENNLGWCVTGNDGNIYVIIKDIQDTETVLHECIHAINKLFSCKYCVTTLEDDELYVRYVSKLQYKMLNYIKTLNNENTCSE